MALSIKTPEADALARRLARLTGETMTEAVTVALRERLSREEARRAAANDLPQRLAAFAERVPERTTRGRYRRWSGMRRPVTKPDRQPLPRLVVVDSSAVVAILFGEPSAVALLAQLAAYPERLMSAANYVETGTVLAGRRHGDRADAIRDLDASGIVLASIDAAQAKVALETRIRFGRGMGHGGALNFGDTFAYALAKLHAAPLLYTGDDFSRTDIVAA